MQNTLLEKPTFVNLLNSHHITMPRLAQAAGIHLTAVRQMAQNKPVQLTVAQQVLRGLYWLTGVYYRLEDVDVVLVPSAYVIRSVYHEGEEEALHVSF